MILVDTSVLIDYLRGKKNIGVQKFDYIVEMSIPFGITFQIYQELLQGTVNKKEFNDLKSHLDTFTFYSVCNGRESFAKAAEIFFLCRKKGITIRSSIDCLIVQITIENDLKLLHNDRDFNAIKKVVKELESF